MGGCFCLHFPGAVVVCCKQRLPGSRDQVFIVRVGCLAPGTRFICIFVGCLVRFTGSAASLTPSTALPVAFWILKLCVPDSRDFNEALPYFSAWSTSSALLVLTL